MAKLRGNYWNICMYLCNPRSDKIRSLMFPAEPIEKVMNKNFSAFSLIPKAREAHCKDRIKGYLFHKLSGSGLKSFQF